MSRLRSATVEPVLGTLINFTGMKRVNARGIAAAEKHVLMASLCYNLKKLLKFKPRSVETAAIKVQVNTGNPAKIFSDLFFTCFGSFSAETGHCFSVPGNFPCLNGRIQGLILPFSRKYERM